MQQVTEGVSSVMDADEVTKETADVTAEATTVVRGNQNVTPADGGALKD